MKSIIGLTILFSLASCYKENWTELTVTWSRDRTGINKTAFFKIPSTLSEAVAGLWKEVDVSNDLNLQGAAINGTDYNVVPLYDCNGYLAGVQYSLSAAVIDLTGPSNNDLASDVTQTIEAVNGELHYISRFLLVDPDFLRTGACRTGLTNGVIGEGLWLRNVTATSGYTQYSDSISEVLNNSLYAWQNCIPTMGTHYYYKQPAEECNRFTPWALLAKKDSVLGLAYQVFGNSSMLVEERNWFEPITRSGVETALPLINECLFDTSETNGVVSIHFFFIPDPWTTTCNQTTDSVVPITSFD